VWADDFLVVITDNGKAKPGDVDFKLGSAAFGPVNSSILMADTAPPGTYRIRYDCRNGRLSAGAINCRFAVRIPLATAFSVPQRIPPTAKRGSRYAGN
jgi:hypothetical protein